MGRIVNIKQLRGSIVRKIERERGVTIDRSTGEISKRRSSSRSSSTTSTRSVSFAGVKSPEVQKAIVERMTERGDVIVSGRGRSQQQEILRQEALSRRGYTSEIQATSKTYTPMTEGFRKKLAVAEQEQYVQRGIEAQRRTSTSQAVASRMGAGAREEKKGFDTRSTYTAAPKQNWFERLERYGQSKELEGGQLAGFTALSIGAFTGTVRGIQSIFSPVQTAKGLYGFGKEAVATKGESVMQAGYGFGQRAYQSPGFTVGEIAGPAAISYGVSYTVSKALRPRVVGSTESVGVKATTFDLPGDEQITSFKAKGGIDVVTKRPFMGAKKTTVGIDATGYEYFSQPKLKSFELMKTDFTTGKTVVKGKTAATTILKQADEGYTFQKYGVTELSSTKDVFRTKGTGFVKTSPKLLGETFPAEPASSMIGITTKGKEPLNILRQQTFKLYGITGESSTSTGFLQKGATLTKYGAKYGDDLTGFYYPKGPGPSGGPVVVSPGKAPPVTALGDDLVSVQRTSQVTKPVVTTKQFTKQAEQIVQSSIPKAKGTTIPIISQTKPSQKTSQVTTPDVLPQPQKAARETQRPYTVFDYDRKVDKSIRRRTSPAFDVMPDQAKRTIGGSRQRPKQIQAPDIIQQPAQAQIPRQLVRPIQTNIPRQTTVAKPVNVPRTTITPGFPTKPLIMPPLKFKFYMPASTSGLSVPKTRARYQTSIYGSFFNIKTPKSVGYSGLLRGVIPGKKKKRKGYYGF